MVLSIYFLIYECTACTDMKELVFGREVIKRSFHVNCKTRHVYKYRPSNKLIQLKKCQQRKMAESAIFTFRTEIRGQNLPLEVTKGSSR